MNAPDTKTCPDCAEEIKAEARVCRYCGYRFNDPGDSSPTATAQEGSQAEATPPPLDTPSEVRHVDLGRAEKGTKRHRWSRVLGFSVSIVLWVIFVIPLAVRQIDEGGSADVAAAYLAAVIVSLGLAALIRGVYAMLRKRPFWSPWLFLIAALIAFLSYSGQVATQEEAIERATPNPSGTSSERIRANREAAEWSRTRAPILLDYLAAVGRNSVFIRRLTNDGNSPGVRELARSIQSAIDAAIVQWAALTPTPLADLGQVDRDLLQAMRLASSAFSDYNAGLRANVASRLALAEDESSLALLDVGDAKLNRAVRVVLTIQTERLPALNEKYAIR